MANLLQSGQSRGRSRRQRLGACCLLLPAALAAAWLGPATARTGAAQSPPDSRPVEVPDSRHDYRFNTFAVISSPELRKSGMSDLVTAELGRIAGVRLVERDQLDAVTELSNASLLGSAAAGRRLQLGRRVRADALVVLTEEPKPAAAADVAIGPTRSHLPARPASPGLPSSAAPPTVQLVICDCACGARLRSVRLPCPPDRLASAAEAVASTVRDVREQYRDGVKWVVGTSPFVSRNLTHDYDANQQIFATLLDNALGSVPGVAVLEVEEAQTVGREGASAGPVETGVAGRLVPIFVEGEFEVAAPPGPSPTPTHSAATAKSGDTRPFDPVIDPATPSPRPTVSFVVKLTTGMDGQPHIVRKQLPLDEAPAFLGEALPAELLRLDPLAAQKMFTPEAQYAALIARADEFDRVAGIEHAIPILEAALLLKPHGPREVGLRCRLIEQYAKLLDHDVRGLNDPNAETAFTPQIDQASQHGMDLLEYLIRNRLVSRPKAIWLARQLRWTYPAVIVPDGPPWLRRFLTEVFPLALDLAPGPPVDPEAIRKGPTDDLDLGAWLDVVFLLVNPKARISWSGGRWMTPEAFDLLADLLERHVRADRPPSRELWLLFTRLPGGASWSLEPFRRPLPATPPQQAAERAYAVFLERMDRSGNPTLKWMGRFIQMKRRFSSLSAAFYDPRPPEPLPSAELIDALAREVDAFDADYHREVARGATSDDVLSSELIFIQTSLVKFRKWQETGKPPADQAATRPVAVADTATDKGNRAWLQVLPMRVKLQSGIVLPYGKLHANYSAFDADEHLLACGDAMDVLYSQKDIFLWRQKDLLEQVTFPRNPAPQFTDLAWDGDRIWVATCGQGIWVMDTQGRIVARVGEADGLPTVGDKLPLLLHPLGRGRIFATGALGTRAEPRGWCATVGLDFAPDGKPAGAATVKVLLKATIVPTELERNGDRTYGIDKVFWPGYIQEFRPPPKKTASNPTGPRLLIGRLPFGSHDPLVADLTDPSAPLFSLPANRLSVKLSSRTGRGLLMRDGGLFVTGEYALGRIAVTRDDEPPPSRGKPATADATGEPRHPLRFAPEPDLMYRRLDPKPMQGPVLGLTTRILPDGDTLYLPGIDRWLRLDMPTLAVERLAWDEQLSRSGALDNLGVSGRYGVVTWGREFARVVVAPQDAPPPDTPHARTFIVHGRDVPTLWLADRPTPSAQAILPTDLPPEKPVTTEP